MGTEGLGQLLILLAAVMAVVMAVRRLQLPPILGYLAAGMALGPYALGLVDDTPGTRWLAELGVVFLLFTLGLEFSLPRMLAMRREVLGLGTAQVGVTTAIAGALAWWAGAPPLVAVVIGGAVSMSSTALVLHQMTEQAELNRTHGRLAFSILLFQDLVFVLFLALATALVTGGTDGAFDPAVLVEALAKAGIALAIVLLAGRTLLRPLFFEITRSRVQELFTLAVLFTVLTAAWATHAVGLSLALGAFLAGLLLAETEYRHQVEAVIKPFRDILLGLFFISVGMLLDVRLLWNQFAVISGMLVLILVVKVLVIMVVARPFTPDGFKTLRAGIVMAGGGEFGFALLTLLVQARIADGGLLQPLLAALVLSMVLSPLLIRHNKRLTRFMRREHGPDTTALARETAPLAEVAKREHVILCGYGRVGQNIGRVLDRQGHEFIAMDLDPVRVRNARQAGDAVVFGDSADEEVLKGVGLAHASVVVVTFADPPTAIGIVRAIRRLRADVPVLVRTADDTHVNALQGAGATEVVPETFEASLMLVSHVLLCLHVPTSRVVRLVGEIRGERYSAFRGVIRARGERPADDRQVPREELATVVLPPKAWAVGRSLLDLRPRGVEASITAVRRDGITGRDPDPAMLLREGDVVVLYGTPEAIEHAEAVLLAG